MNKISKQIWKPDTCECEIEQTFDYSTNPAILVEGKHLKRCSLHKIHTHDQVLEHNRQKNNAKHK